MYAHYSTIISHTHYTIRGGGSQITICQRLTNIYPNFVVSNLTTTTLLSCFLTESNCRHIKLTCSRIFLFKFQQNNGQITINIFWITKITIFKVTNHHIITIFLRPQIIAVLSYTRYSYIVKLHTSEGLKVGLQSVYSDMISSYYKVTCCSKSLSNNR